MDRFNELNAFIAVVEAGGFTAAARRTGDSQSAIPMTPSPTNSSPLRYCSPHF
jgi:hypothetical protein